jgi:hypothetical protein
MLVLLLKNYMSIVVECPNGYELKKLGELMTYLPNISCALIVPKYLETICELLVIGRLTQQRKPAFFQ